MRCAILIFCAGIVSGTFVSDVPFFLTRSLCVVAIVAILLCVTRPFCTNSLAQRLLLLSLPFLLGFAWHMHWASAGLDQRLPKDLEGVTLQVEGVVVGLPESSLIAQQFLFEILHSPSAFHPRKITLNYYGDTVIMPGQYWHFAVRLNRPHGFANPGGFDYEGWLFQQGVSARGYVRESASNKLLATRPVGASLSLVIRLQSLRYGLRTRIERLSGDAPYASLLVALVLGDRSAISQDQWNLFSATGSNHLFVISGLHIGLVSGFCYFLSLLIGRLLGFGRFAPAQKIAGLVALIAAFIYALLAGFTLPTQRAFIMIGVLLCGLFWNTRYLISFRLCLALLLVLTLNPLAAISSGFWLSFVAVAGLLAFAGPTPSRLHKEIIGVSLLRRLKLTLGNFIRPQLIVLVALALPLVFFTGQLSLISPVVNIVAIPIVGFLVVPLCFTALMLGFVHEGMAAALLSTAHGMISLLIQFMEALAQWGASYLQIQFSQPGILQFVALFFAALLLLLPKGVCRRGLIVPLILPFIPLSKSIGSTSEIENSLRVHIIDVGQGLSVIVQTAGHTLLFDSGANLSPDFNIGSAVVVPALRALGITRLDTVVISHGDNDHAGGLSGIRGQMAIDEIIANATDVDPDVEATLCDTVSDWNWDGVEFRFLQTGLDFPDENNNSCVLQLRFSGVAILLPGDIEREAELQLVLRYGDELASTVLLAPHHGSISSSSYGLLKRVRPDYVIFSAGYHNSFGHPHETVVARYGEFSTEMLTTSRTGMVSFDFGVGALSAPVNVKAQIYREQNIRYWR